MLMKFKHATKGTAVHIAVRNVMAVYTVVPDEGDTASTFTEVLMISGHAIPLKDPLHVVLRDMNNALERS